MNALVLRMAVIISAPTLLDHTPVSATQDMSLLPMKEDVSFFIHVALNYELMTSFSYALRFLGHHYCLSAYTGDDIDECAGPNICQQVCTNTEGSFTCGCEAGYVLDSDGASCSGINL